MLKYIHFIFALCCITCIAACGGGSSTTAATQVYVTLPGALAASPANPLVHSMGGSTQGTPLALSNTVSTVAGTAGIGNAGFENYAGIVGTTAKFSLPNDITTDGTNFYVADYLNNIVRLLSPSGNVQTLSDNVTGLAIGCNRPSGITTDGTNLYVVNSGSNTISIINIVTKAVTTIGSTSGLAGSIDVQVVSPATTADVTLARFNQPTGITTDGVNLYVTDSGNQTVRQINIITQAVSTVAGASGTIGSADGIQGAARFNVPSRITTDGTGLYLTDLGNRIIRKIDIATGAVSTLAGSTGPLGADDGTTDGIGAAAHFNQPNGITTDGTYLYVTDSYHNTIRRIEKTTGNVVTISGVSRTAGKGGSIDSPGIPSYYTPIGITTDGTSLFVADTYNNTIRKIR